MFMPHDKMALKAYYHNVLCTAFLVSINQTSGQTGKLQKPLSLLQTIFGVCQKKHEENLLCLRSSGPSTA